MYNVTLISIDTNLNFGLLNNSLKIKNYRVSGPEYSFSSAFKSDFAIDKWVGINRLIARIKNGFILNENAFGNLKVPYFVFLTSISKERYGNLELLYLNLYYVGQILYIVEEAKHNRLEKVAIKNVIIQDLTTTNYAQPYKMFDGKYYSILYEDTLERYWEEQELTLIPESFFNWYPQSMTGIKNIKSKEVEIKSLGKRKKNVDWTKIKLFLKEKAEKGELKRIKVKKARVKKGDVLSYTDESDNTWDEKDLVFEQTALILINKFRNKEKNEKN